MLSLITMRNASVSGVITVYGELNPCHSGRWERQPPMAFIKRSIPKQFLTLDGSKHSLLQQTLLRLDGLQGLRSRHRLSFAMKSTVFWWRNNCKRSIV